MVWLSRVKMRCVLSVSIILVAIPSITYLLFFRQVPAPRGRPLAIARPRLVVQPGARGDAVRALCASAAEQWRHQGLVPDAAAALEQELNAVVGSYIEKDFDAFAELMGRHGARLIGERAEIIVRTHLKRVYASSKPNWDTAAIADVVRAAWTDPARRGATWQSIDPERVRVGTGWRIGSEETEKSFMIMVSMFESPESDSLMKRAQAGQLQAAWVEFPVGFEEGQTAELRLYFIQDDRSNSWIPIRLLVLGPEPKPPLLF
jgi:hypothetical protein